VRAFDDAIFFGAIAPFGALTSLADAISENA
jgi:hypothetical protein